MNIFRRLGTSTRLPKMLRNNHGFAGTIAALIAIGGAVGVGGAGLAAGLTGAAIAGTAAFGATSLLTNAIGGGGQQLSEIPQAQTQSASDIIASSNSAAEDQRKDILRAKRRNTVLTGPTGIFEEADTAKKTLLGA